MKSRKWIIGAIAMLTISFSCTNTHVAVLLKSPNFNISSDNSKTVIITDFDSISLKGFNRTFKRLYSTEREFKNDYNNLFAEKIREVKILSRINVDKSNDWNYNLAYNKIRFII